MSTDSELSRKLADANARIEELSRFVSFPEDDTPVFAPPKNDDSVASLYIPNGLADLSEYLDSIDEDEHWDARRIWFDPPELSLERSGKDLIVNLYCNISVNHSTHWGLEAELVMSLSPYCETFSAGIKAAAVSGSASFDLVFEDGQCHQITTPLPEKIRSSLTDIVCSPEFGDSTFFNQEEWILGLRGNFTLDWFPRNDIYYHKSRSVEGEGFFTYTYWFGWWS